MKEVDGKRSRGRMNKWKTVDGFRSGGGATAVRTMAGEGNG